MALKSSITGMTTIDHEKASLHFQSHAHWITHWLTMQKVPQIPVFQEM